MRSIGSYILQPFSFQEFPLVKSPFRLFRIKILLFLLLNLRWMAETDGKPLYEYGISPTYPYKLLHLSHELVISLVLNPDLKCLEIKIEDYDIFII